MSASRIEYSEKYADDHNEYRYAIEQWHCIGSQSYVANRTLSINTSPHSSSHVILPKDLAKTLPKSRLLTESEWRSIGVQQSRGWQHYAIHR